MTTRAGVGLSLLPDPGAAAAAAARQAMEGAGITGADWALLFATAPHRPHYGTVLREARAILGTDRIAGCGAWGLVAGSHEVEGRPAVAVLAVRSEHLRAETLLAPMEQERPAAAASEILRRPGAPDGDGLLMLFPDPFAARPDELLAGLDRLAPGVRAIGGACSGDPAAQATYQFCGRNVATRSLTGLRLSGASGSAIGITQGCQPLGPACRVTRGDGNVILELDGRPALEVLRARLPEALRDSLPRLGAHLFLGWPPDPDQEAFEPGEYLVRPLLGADPGRGALAAGSTIREGQPLLFVLRDPAAARDDLKEMLGRLQSRARGITPRFALYFNCAGRGSSLYGVAGVDTAFITGMFGDLPLIGFFGNAEIAPLRGRNRVFTYTGVLVLVGDAAGDP